jgi:hypothetical protein
VQAHSFTDPSTLKIGHLAVKLPAKRVDRVFLRRLLAVGRASGELAGAWGGVPLRTSPGTPPVFVDHVKRITMEGRSYFLYDEPILGFP